MASLDIAGMMIAKLATRVQLDQTDAEAIRTLPFIDRHYEAPAYIVREGEQPKRHCSFVVNGFALRQN